MRRALLVMGVALVLGVMTTGCDGSTQTAIPPSSRSSLADAIISPPSGFSLSTQSDVHNGPMDAEGFARMVGSSDAATQWHFVAGYEETFDSRNDDSSVEIAVLQFTAPTAATNYDVDTVRAYASEGMVTTHTVGIATSLDLNSAAADATGHYRHLVVMHKESRVVAIVYYNRVRAAGRLTSSIARREFERI